MRVWLINIGEQIPTDPRTPRLLRTGILAQYLVSLGHEVTWWNSTVNHQEKIQRFSKTTFIETDEGYRLILLSGHLYRRNISPTRILSLIQNAKEFNKAVLKEKQPDVILCGYPSIELAKAATNYAKAKHIPIAIDFRDMWPDIFEDYIPSQFKWIGRFLFAGWQNNLRDIVQNATSITGITDAYVKWACEKGARKPKNIDRAFHLALNPQVPDNSQIEEASVFWDNYGITEGNDLIIGSFAGVLSKRHDFRTIIKGLTLLSKEMKQKFKLVFCGRGDALEEFKDLVAGEPNIIFPGWRNAAEIHVLLSRSKFGMLPYRSTKDFLMSYPNKVGEYFSAGLPIMTGLKGQTEQLLRERDLGFFYEEGNSDSAARCLSNMLAQKDTLIQKKGYAMKAYHELFDGSNIYPEFCSYLEKLAEK